MQVSTCSEGGCANPHPPLVERTLAAAQSFPTLVAQPVTFTFTLDAQSSGASVLLTWVPPATPNGGSLSYTVTRNGTTVYSAVAAGNAPFVDTELAFDTSYSSSLLACNEAGCSAAVTAAAHTAEGVSVVSRPISFCVLVCAVLII